MGGLALIARQIGHTVTGSDQNVYPPMSTQLQQQGIELMSGYRPENLDHKPDLVIIGNAMSRGNPEVEAVLNRGIPYVSGPQWLAEEVLQHRWVLGVSGTHGKTTTTSMLAWILEYNGFAPGFLIGGVANNFGISARLGESDFFVIEADEYDSAFFDKRSKFIHYRPRTAILNNLEFDHADIFDNLDAIKKQFHYFVRTIPSEGLIIAPQHDQNLDDVLNLGCWTPVVRTGIAESSDWEAELNRADGSDFNVRYQGQNKGQLIWNLSGRHNVFNALSAIAAARHIGIESHLALEALKQFKNVKRRLEIIYQTDHLTVYDDFAHHPTAIATTLEGLRNKVGAEKIIAVVEPRSNTMRMGIHTQTLAESLAIADQAIVFQPEGLTWDLSTLSQYAQQIQIFDNLDEIVTQLSQQNQGHIVIMSNGSFGGIYQRLKDALD